MEISFQGQTTVIFGAGGGIGEAVARTLPNPM